MPTKPDPTVLGWSAARSNGYTVYSGAAHALLCDRLTGRIRPACTSTAVLSPEICNGKPAGASHLCRKCCQRVDAIRARAAKVYPPCLLCGGDMNGRNGSTTAHQTCADCRRDRPAQARETENRSGLAMRALFENGAAPWARFTLEREARARARNE